MYPERIYCFQGKAETSMEASNKEKKHIYGLCMVVLLQKKICPYYN